MDEQQRADQELVRSQEFSVDGPLELDLNVSVGRIDVRLGPPASGPDGESRGQDPEALVEVRHAPSAQAPWAEGMSAVLSWVGERFGDQFGDQLGAEFRARPAEAVEQTRVELAGGRLVVHGPKALPLRNVPLMITVHAPANSHVDARTGSATVAITGQAGRAQVTTGSGDITLERASATATLRTGSGGITAGNAGAGAHVKTGSGTVEISELLRSGTVTTGTGSVHIGAVAGDVLARTGSGSVTVADAASGAIELATGSGEIRIGVRSGSSAEIDISSGSGRVSSELDVADTRPERPVDMTIRARTGSGAAVVTGAA